MQLQPGKKALDSQTTSRHTSLRNVAHPCAPPRGPCRSPGTASRLRAAGPVEAPHRSSCSYRMELSDGTAPRRVVRPLSTRGQRRAPLPHLLHIGSLHNAITASSSTRSSARYERANAKGQPHSADSDTRKPQRPRKGSRINEDGRRQQDLEPQRPRAARVHRQPPQPDLGETTRLRRFYP